ATDGGSGDTRDGRSGDTRDRGSAAEAFDPMAEPAPGFTARDAQLPPVTAPSGPRLHRRTLTVTEAVTEVAPGVRQKLWTFGGTAPGPSLTYRFTATRSGIWMYHCATMPMSLHIANGMFGAVIIDPPGLPEADREYVLVQSEFYLGAQNATADPDKIRAGRPDMVAF